MDDEDELQSRLENYVEPEPEEEDQRSLGELLLDNDLKFISVNLFSDFHIGEIVPEEED